MLYHAAFKKMRGGNETVRRKEKNRWAKEQEKCIISVPGVCVRPLSLPFRVFTRGLFFNSHLLKEPLFYYYFLIIIFWECKEVKKIKVT